MWYKLTSLVLIVIVANWKNIVDLESLARYCASLPELEQVIYDNKISVVLAPSHPHLLYLRHHIPLNSSIALSAQDCSSHLDGFRTGEVYADMLADIGCTYVIIGHSERRYWEDGTILQKKISCATRCNLQPIYCIGETIEHRYNGAVLQHLQEQLEEVGIETLINAKAIIAYEPLWSIGTDIVPSLQQISEVATFIKSLFPRQRLLYGGSIDQRNSGEIYKIAGIEGLLVGRASTTVEQLISIISNIRG